MGVYELILDFNNDLLNKKEELNEIVEDIVYGDMERPLTMDDIERINKIRNQIKTICEMVNYNDGKSKEFEEE